MRDFSFTERPAPGEAREYKADGKEHEEESGALGLAEFLLAVDGDIG